MNEFCQMTTFYENIYSRANEAMRQQRQDKKKKTEYVLKSQFDQKTQGRAWGEVEQKRLVTTKLQRNLSHSKTFDFYEVSKSLLQVVFFFFNRQMNYRIRAVFQ